ncbi:MAG: hypothetical protein KF797_07325 [Flavobacteriales bacterium]|nr:hypothetical protein [Flavobacteriales bacterium]
MTAQKDMKRAASADVSGGMDKAIGPAQQNTEVPRTGAAIRRKTVNSHRIPANTGHFHGIKVENQQHAPYGFHRSNG